MYIPIKNLAQMMRRALNTVDYRLMDHGERVAYITLKLLQHEGKLTHEECIEACYLTMLHDIGAYKTEMIGPLTDIKELFTFELKNTANHAVYSYLFIKNFSILNSFTDAILYHHYNFDKLMQSSCQNKSIAAKIFLADKIDILINKGFIKTVDDALKSVNNQVFCTEDVNSLIAMEKKEQIITKCINYEYLNELLVFLNENPLADTKLKSLVEMLPYTIDFRSASTVTHTIATVEISMLLGKLLNLSEEELNKIYYGALLHDIGKISTAVLILEKPTKLTNFEYDIMKDHVLLSEYILKGTIDHDVEQIAIRHHEKLDGSGYPYGLKGDELTLNQRIIGIADILSALIGRRSYKEPFMPNVIHDILQGMLEKGQICPVVTKAVFDNYDYITLSALKKSDETTERYLKMSEEYELLTLNPLEAK